MRKNNRRSIVRTRAVPQRGEDEDNKDNPCKLPPIGEGWKETNKKKNPPPLAADKTSKSSTLTNKGSVINRVGDGTAPTSHEKREAPSGDMKIRETSPSNAAGFNMSSVGKSRERSKNVPLNRQRSRSLDELDMHKFSAAVSSPTTGRADTSTNVSRGMTTNKTKGMRPAREPHDKMSTIRKDKTAPSPSGTTSIRRLRSRSFDGSDDLCRADSSHRSVLDASELKTPRQLLRLRSRSVGDISELHDPPPSEGCPSHNLLCGMMTGVASNQHQLPPLVSRGCALGDLHDAVSPSCPPPMAMRQHMNELYNGTKLFWQCRVTARIMILYHVEAECFEVVAYNCRDKREMGRIYVPRAALAAHTEKSKDLKSVKVHRPDLLERARQHCSAEYIASMLESDATGSSIYMTAFDADKNEVVDMTVPQPLELVPAANTFEDEVNKPVDSQRAEQILAELERFRQEMTTHSNMAQRETTRVTEIMSEMAVLCPRWVQDSGGALNPNVFTLARWRWVWGIERVRWVNRVASTIAKLWKSASQGNLELHGMIGDASRGHRYDEHIYVRLQAGEGVTFKASEDFRKLKFDPNMGNTKVASVDHFAMMDMFDSFSASKERRRQTRRETVNDRTKVLAGHDMRDDVRLNRIRRREEERELLNL